MENIRIAVLSASDETCTFLDNTIGKAMHYWEDSLHTYLKGSAYTYTFKTFTEHKDNEFLSVGNKLSFIYKEKGYYLNIVNVERDEVYTTVTAYGLSLELTNEEVASYSAEKSMSFVEYINAFNFEVPFEIGINEVSNKSIKYEWEGSSTILARLFSLATVFSAELEFITELDNNYQLKRIVLNVYREHDDNYQGLGADKTNEGTLKYGKGITGITKTSDITELYTAIKPTGTENLTIKDKEYHEYDNDGNLLYFTELNSDIIYAPVSRDRFPSTLTSDINERYIVKPYSYETTNINTLFGHALSQLKKNCEPQVSYTITGYIDGNIGDTFTIEDDEYTPTLYLQARITEQQISFTNKDDCSTTFDNFEEVTSQIDSSLIDEMKALINANKQYDATIISDNGIVFKNNTGSTTLKALINDNGIEVTNDFAIKWYKDGELIATSSSILVNSTDVTDKAIYRFEGFKNDILKANYEVTVINVDDGKEGQPGQKGDDGKSPTIELSKKDDTTTIKVNNVDGTTSTETIKDGQDGQKGDDGKSVTSINLWYGLSTSSASDGYSLVEQWESNIPNWKTNYFIWQKAITSIDNVEQEPVYTLYGAFNSLAKSVDGNTSKITQTANALGVTFSSDDKATSTLIRETDEGIEVGKSTDGSTYTGTHTVVGTDAFSVHDANHNELANFGNKVTIGNTKNNSKNIVVDENGLTFRQGTTNKATFTSALAYDGVAEYMDIIADDSLRLSAGTYQNPHNVYMNPPLDGEFESDCGIGLTFPKGTMEEVKIVLMADSYEIKGRDIYEWELITDHAGTSMKTITLDLPVSRYQEFMITIGPTSSKSRILASTTIPQIALTGIVGSEVGGNHQVYYSSSYRGGINYLGNNKIQCYTNGGGAYLRLWAR